MVFMVMKAADRGMNKVGSRGQLCIGWHTRISSHCLIGVYRSAQAQDDGCGEKYLTMRLAVRVALRLDFWLGSAISLAVSAV